MAFLLESAVEDVLKMLFSIAADRISGAWGLKSDLKKLDATTRMIQDLLQDAEEKQARDPGVKEWIEKLQDVVYSAGDVLDEFSYETCRRQVEIEGRWELKAREFVSHKNPILFHLKMANKVKKINKSLADIEREASRKLNLRKITGSDHIDAGETQFLDRNTDYLLGRSEKPIGRAEDAKKIIEMLQTGSSAPPFLTFIHIVGIGGIGKTTLAKLIFQQVKEMKLFQEIMWVCVSDDFNYERILLKMLQTVDNTTGEIKGADIIVPRLKEKLRNKKFLLVLDDVWEDEAAKWKSLIDRLGKISEKDGNFVLVTTRKTSVAEVVDTAPRHLVKLKQLPNEVCWSIIQNKCLEKWEKLDSVLEELESIGLKIAEKCGGVPLIAQVLGGMLSSRKDRAFWLTIQNSSTWEDIGAKNSILPVLELSFHHLPPPVKRCFTYCSLFPKDFEFEKEVLIQLWMAEEFLHERLRNDGGTEVRSMEEVGEEYFSILLANSFFQDSRVDDWGNITHCKMHDILHDLASSISKTQMLPFGDGCVYKTCDDRRFNFECKEVSEGTEWTTIVRAVFSKVDVTKLLHNLKSLRSLSMSEVDFKELPFSIKKLKHLRYFSISGNNIEVLPEPITMLYNLQVLRLHKCNSLKKLPDGVGNLVNLRHIYFDDKRLMIFKVRSLTRLQTLPYFVVGSKQGYRICELKFLTQLRGEVEICNMEQVRDGEEAKQAELEEKKISDLKLKWNEVDENEREASSSSSSECNHEDVLTNLQPGPCLRSLIIERYMGMGFPQWMSIKSVDSPYPLEILVNLELRNCKKCKKMPTLGHLPCLKKVEVEGMDGVKSIGDEFYGESNSVNLVFPVLEELCIRRMDSLVEWEIPLGNEPFPKLRRVEIEDCPKLRSFGLSQLLSSANIMPFRVSYNGISACLKFSCLIDLKSLNLMDIYNCPELMFPHLGLKSPKNVILSRWMPKDISEKLSNGLEVMKVEVEASEMDEEIPKSCKVVKFKYFDKLLADDAFHGLSSLQCLQIKWCERLESIPSLSSLSSLQRLQIEWCESLVSMPSLSFLSSLQHLQIEMCGRLESIPSLSSLSSLQHLQIEGCDSLKSIPSLSSLVSLQMLEISSCWKLSYLSLDFLSTLTCLEELTLSHPKSTSVPSGIKSCHSLKKLHIFDWDELIDLSPIFLPALTSLETLLVNECPKLRSLPGEIKLCTSLKELSVVNCKGLTSVDDDMFGSLNQLKILEWGDFSDEFVGLNSIHLLSSLQTLRIFRGRKLTSLPHQIQNLSFITELEIWYFDGLESLPDWLDKLSSLQTLKITGCRNLKNLSTAMQRLPKLESLEIWSCLLLEEKCEKNIGSEWSNICHIPRIKIGYKVIQDRRHQ